MIVRGHGVAILRRGDVVDRKDEMVFRRDVGRPLDPVDEPQQSHDMPGAGLIDRRVKTSKRADMNHMITKGDSFVICMTRMPQWKAL